MSPELEDVLRLLAKQLGIEKTFVPRGGGRDAVQAMINAIAKTIMEMREPPNADRV